MRCPKCGFNSFDHNLACPKCHKDLSVIRRQLNVTMPISGPVDFFKAAYQCDITPEPALGPGSDEAEALVAPFPPASFAAASPAAALGIDDILPLEDDSIDGIDSIEEVEEIYPMMDSPALPGGPPPLYPEAQPPYPAVTPEYGQEAQYALPPQAPAPASPPVYPEIPDYLPPFDALAPMSLADRAQLINALISDGEDEEIEIEIEAEGLDDGLPVDLPVPQAVRDQANAAMGQIMDALAETGDLAANIVIPNNINELLESPAFLGQELNLDEPGPIQKADEWPAPLGPAPDAAQRQAVETDPAPAESEDLAKLAEEINLDDLDSEL